MGCGERVDHDAGLEDVAGLRLESAFGGLGGGDVHNGGVDFAWMWRWEIGILRCSIGVGIWKIGEDGIDMLPSGSVGFPLQMHVSERGRILE